MDLDNNDRAILKLMITLLPHHFVLVISSTRQGRPTRGTAGPLKSSYVPRVDRRAEISLIFTIVTITAPRLVGWVSPAKHLPSHMSVHNFKAAAGRRRRLPATALATRCLSQLRPTWDTDNYMQGCEPKMNPCDRTIIAVNLGDRPRSTRGYS